MANSNRLFLSLSDEELALFENARKQLGMTRSRYVRYLIAGQKEMRPFSIRYREFVQKIADIERDMKVLAMKDELSDLERLQILTALSDIKQLLANEKETSGQVVQK